MIYRLLPLLFLLACQKPAVVQHEAEPACPDGGSNRGAMAVCSGDAFKSADRRLGELLGELQAALGSNQRAQLDSAQQGWTTYAAAQCRLASAQHEGGSGYSMQVAKCRRGLSETRIRELAPLLCKGAAPGAEPCPAAARYLTPSMDPVVP
jgi:uncharacterized protein YecT (DUF1311 family)